MAAGALVAPGSVTVSSKWGYVYTAGWRVEADPPEVKELSADTLRRQLAETREQLGPYLSLYQIHSATVSSGVLDDPDVGRELDALRAEGVAIGLSVSGIEQAQTILRAIATGSFDTVQATWNLLERAAAAALEAAHQAGLGVIIKEALANGRLGPRGAIPPLAQAARRLGVSEDAVAIAGVLARPWADTVLSEATTVSQLASNLEAVSVVWNAGLEDELAALAEPSERYWATRSSLPWT